MLRGTVYLIDTGGEPDRYLVRRVIVTLDVQTVDGFKASVWVSEIAADHAYVEFGPIGRPWN